MAEIAKNPIKNYEHGKPCMLGEVVGRIVGEDDDGSWGDINGKDMFSVPLFSTPHGTIFRTGVFYLSEITKKGMKQLTKYEDELKAKKKEMYAGKINEILEKEES